MEVSYYKDIYNYLTKKYSNSKIYTISDHHFFHQNILKYGRQQFNNVLEMNKYIITKHNETVGKNDIVIFLGDFSFNKSEIRDLLSKMNGYKFLILGNHDKNELTKNYINLGFEGVFSVPVKINNKYLSHYPLNDKELSDVNSKLLLKEFDNNPDSINYHGHIHNGNVSLDKYKNVSCEMIDYKPLLIGKTGEKRSDKKLFIESKYFPLFLAEICSRKNLPSSLLILDYVYSMMLENNNLDDFSFIYGSYSQYKKYGYISNIGDLDMSVIYDDNISKAKNLQRIKTLTDDIYCSINKLDNINLKFLKRYTNMRAFEYFYSNGYSYGKGALDVNLIPVNFYKDSDFVLRKEKTSIEKFIPKNWKELVKEYDFPEFESKFLNTDGDIANLILQILYQRDNPLKKEQALRKLKYISKFFSNDISLDNEDIQDTITRFFLRNIVFLYTLRRSDEINYIKNNNDIKIIIEGFPSILREKSSNILLNSNSYFNYVFNEIFDTPTENIISRSRELVKKQ